MEISAPLPTSPAGQKATLWAKAEEVEAAFLAEMLAMAGLEGRSGTFGGGIGEEQFSSFLREAQARAMVQAGGIGLAERIFEALVKGDA
ncbi:rod-binding protein [Tabrizicola sp. M-4]|uniref:rod-binding protein n=1 Tax=Tabrizicola sp. M-4 TaxID=3055847 RepID=UPI003DAA0D46